MNLGGRLATGTSSPSYTITLGFLKVMCSMPPYFFAIVDDIHLCTSLPKEDDLRKFNKLIEVRPQNSAWHHSQDWVKAFDAIIKPFRNLSFLSVPTPELRQLTEDLFYWFRENRKWVFGKSLNDWISLQVMFSVLIERSNINQHRSFC